MSAPVAAPESTQAPGPSGPPGAPGRPGDEPPLRGVSWLVGPFVLAAFVIGQLVVEIALYALLRLDGVKVRDAFDVPAVPGALRLLAGQLVGGALALAAVRFTTRAEDPRPIASWIGPLRPSWLGLALLVAPCASILAADAEALLLHLLPRSAKELALYKFVFFPDAQVARVLTMVATIVMAPLIEEMVFRGALRGGLARRYGVAAGAVLTALLFAVAHMSLRAGGILFLLGLGNAILARRSGGLALPMATHALYNATFYLLPERAVLAPAPTLGGGPALPWLVLAGAAVGMVVGCVGLGRVLQRSNSPAMP